MRGGRSAVLICVGSGASPPPRSAGKTREAEQQRVDKELANIRKAFTSGTMSEWFRRWLRRWLCIERMRRFRAEAYDRKKYVWKLVYVHMRA